MNNHSCLLPMTTMVFGQLQISFVRGASGIHSGTRRGGSPGEHAAAVEAVEPPKVGKGTMTEPALLAEVASRNCGVCVWFWFWHILTAFLGGIVCACFVGWNTVDKDPKCIKTIRNQPATHYNTKDDSVVSCFAGTAFPNVFIHIIYIYIYIV